jgi:uncharacterized protein (DUF427 family)
VPEALPVSSAHSLRGIFEILAVGHCNDESLARTDIDSLTTCDVETCLTELRSPAARNQLDTWWVVSDFCQTNGLGATHIASMRHWQESSKERTMGLSWQQGPLSPGRIGRFLVPDSLPDRLLYAEPLRRRMRVRFSGVWIADSEHVVLLHEPGRYPVAYFPRDSIAAGALQPGEYTTHHRDLGLTSWYTVCAGEHSRPRAAWQHTALPAHASELHARVAFAWPVMDAFYEEDERIVGHAADSYHRSTSARPAVTS